MEVTYEMTCATMYDHEIGAYTSYEMSASKDGKIIRSIPDISVNRNALEELVRKCNESNLAIVHMQDVVEDWLVC